MKKRICKFIYGLFYWLDRKNIQEYNYETAPYCGHHYNGHTGRFTSSDYHEGDGGKEVKFGVLFKITHNTWDGWHWYPPCLSMQTTWYYNGEQMGKSNQYHGLKDIMTQRKCNKNAKKFGIIVKEKFSIK